MNNTNALASILLPMSLTASCTYSTLDTAAPDAPYKPLQPLILIVHGSGGTGASESAYWQMEGTDAAIIMAPTSPSGQWHASLSCCDPTFQQQDDENLTNMVKNRIAQGDIDPMRVSVVGHSNGGFMAWRLLCDHADVFRSGIIFEGAANANGDPECHPSQPINVLHIHSTGDQRVQYYNPAVLPNMAYTLGSDAVPYVQAYGNAPTGNPGSLTQESIAADCDGDYTSDYLFSKLAYKIVDGYTTDTFTHLSCGGTADFWRINGAPHEPSLTQEWYPAIVGWLSTHYDL
jgi:polyhydroxybutyrate depolymerase